MKLNLTEIPLEGKQFIWNSATGEVNSILKDLIGKHLYSAEFFIKPLNKRDFEMTGFIKTEIPEQCSRCCKDFDLPIFEKFHEILIPPQEQPRNGKYAKVNHVSDLSTNLDFSEVSMEIDAAGTSLGTAAETTEYELNMNFDMGEYLHSVVGLAQPFNPVGPEDENGNCVVCQIPVRGRDFGYDEKLPVNIADTDSKRAFDVLKQLKLN